MIFKDYYKILGFETNKVTLEEIKIAYRDQAKKYHPDLNDGSNRAEERFKDINEAYRILSDTNSRKKYDRSWNNNIGRIKNKQENTKSTRQNETVIQEVINMFFGQKKEEEQEEEKPQKGKIKIKGENVETAINVTIEEAFFGITKNISLRAVNRKNEEFQNKNPSGY